MEKARFKLTQEEENKLSEMGVKGKTVTEFVTHMYVYREYTISEELLCGFVDWVTATHKVNASPDVLLEVLMKMPHFQSKQDQAAWLAEEVSRVRD